MSKKIRVKSYRKKDGTQVKSHFRVIEGKKQKPKKKNTTSFSILLEKHYSQSEQELQEVQKKIEMVQNDLTRLDDKADVLRYDIDDTEKNIKGRQGDEGKKKFTEYWEKQHKIPSGKPFTPKEIEEMRRETIKSLKEDIKIWSNEMLKYQPRILERKKQLDVLKGQEQGLMEHIEYIEDWKKNPNWD